jgi:hypothetical protein
MGLYGVLVIATAPVVTGDTNTTPAAADPGIGYDADVALLLSEIDPEQNSSVDVFPGPTQHSSCRLQRDPRRGPGLRSGSYLLAAGGGLLGSSGPCEPFQRQCPAAFRGH